MPSDHQESLKNDPEYKKFQEKLEKYSLIIKEMQAPLREIVILNKEMCPRETFHNYCKECNNPIIKRTKYITTICRAACIKEKFLGKSGLHGNEINETFKNATVDKYNKKLYYYIQNEWDKKSWLYIYSEKNGVGKSYTANAIANMFLESGIQVIVCREVDMPTEIINTIKNVDYKDTEYQIMARWKNIPILVIQDFGKTVSTSEWWPQKLFDIIDYRSIENKLTIFTSNVDVENPNKIIQRYGQVQGRAIHSRIMGVSNILELDGIDRRQNQIIKSTNEVTTIIINK